MGQVIPLWNQQHCMNMQMYLLNSSAEVWSNQTLKGIFCNEKKNLLSLTHELVFSKLMADFCTAVNHVFKLTTAKVL